MVSRLRSAQPMRRARLERFGAIVQLAWPRALVFVDRAMARHVVRVPAASAQWREPESAVGDHVLSAPLEAHLQLTNRCGAGCAGCYTGASPQGAAREWGLGEWKLAIDALAQAGVFHLALGGGESAVLPWLGELAEYARARGLVPNLTTSGLEGLEALLPIADRFGQINVSIDGLGKTYAAVRGFDGFARADAAVQSLRAIKREIGINVVVTRHNFHELGELFGYARQRRLSEVELLRFKPAGRGAAAYRSLRCTDAQHRAFLPTILAAAKAHRVRVKVDCSYTPMIVHHQPGRELLAGLAVYGCTGGDFLIGAKPDGRMTACSFAAPPPAVDPAPHSLTVTPGKARVIDSGHRPVVTELAAYWQQRDAFGEFRTWRDAPEPCASCDYHALCRGGCKVVSAHVCGDLRSPDPECPRVIDLTRHSLSGGGAHASGAVLGDARPRRHLPVI